MSDIPLPPPGSTGRLKFRVALLVVALLAALHFRYAWFVCQRPPHQDDWAVLAGLFNSSRGGTMAAWLVSPHNGHILVPARLAFWADLHFAHLDLSWVRWLCALIAALGAVLWCRWLRRNLPGDPSLAGLALGGGLVIFSLCYWECYSIAIGFSAYLAALLAAVGFAFLARAFGTEKAGPRPLVAAAACFALAVLTFGSGYAATLAAACWLGIVLVRRRFPFARTLPAAVVRMAPIGLGVALLFSLPSWRPANVTLLDFAYRFCLCVGAFASQAAPEAGVPVHEMLAFGAGVLLVCLSFWRLLLFPGQRDDEPAGLWGTGLLLGGLVTCLAVAYSRLPLSAEEMLSSRYSLHFAAGLLGLLLCLRQRRWIFPGFLGAVAVVTVLAGRQELRVAPYRRTNYGNLESSMQRLSAMSDPEVQRAFYWSGADEIRQVTSRMKQDGLGAFHPVTKR